MVGVDVTTLKMAWKPIKIQRKVQQDALGKVNRLKEISRREWDGLKITDNKHYVRKKVVLCNRLSSWPMGNILKDGCYFFILRCLKFMEIVGGHSKSAVYAVKSTVE